MRMRIMRCEWNGKELFYSCKVYNNLSTSSAVHSHQILQRWRDTITSCSGSIDKYVNKTEKLTTYKTFGPPSLFFPHMMYTVCLWCLIAISPRYKKSTTKCKYMLTKYLYLILLKAIALHMKRSYSSLIHITPWPSNYVNKVANCINPTFKAVLFCIIVNKLKYIKCIL